MGLEQRLKDVRKACGLTQQALADKLGLKQNTIATYEIGKTSPSDRTIADICREFNVNEDWLRTGEGDMFRKVSRNDELTAFMGDILSGDPDFRTRLINVLARMTTEEWALLEKKAYELLDELQKEKADP